MPVYTITDSKTGKTLDVRGDQPPTQAEAAALFAQQPTETSRSRSLGDVAASALPAAGGMIGGMAGGIPGAALGGAAGEGFQQLATHAGELLPALGDVASNLVTQPGATLRGAVSGMQQGLKDSGIQGAVQGAIQGGGQAIGELAQPVLSALGGRVMQGAVKPGMRAIVRSVRNGEAVPPVVKTLLDEGVNVSHAGIAKLQALLGETNQQIASAVANAPGQISPVNVASRLSDTAKTFATQVNPQADLDAISQVGQNFLDHPSITSATISVPEAQALKQGTYARIGEKYGQASPAGIEAEKALGRGLKEEVAKQVPQVSALNAREGRLIDALDVVGKRVALSGNRDPIGFAWVAHNPTTFLAALIDRNPSVKSMIARGLYRSAGEAAQVTPQLIRLAVQAVASGGEGAGDNSSDPGGPR